MIYTVSYVVVGGKKKYPSGMMNQHERPVVGTEVQLGNNVFKITEVKRMLPPVVPLEDDETDGSRG